MVEKIKSYKDLKIWQKGILLSKLVYDLSQNFPDTEKFGLTSQMRRSAVSIPLNIAEGWGRNSTKNYLQFLKIARGSLYELETVLILAKELQFELDEDLVQSIEKEIIEESKMLSAFMQSIETYV